MVAALGSSTALHSLGSGASLVGLEAQVARYEKELSNCVNCASSKTSEGKAEIAAISAKIQTLKSRMAEVSQAKSSDRSLKSEAQTPEHRVISGAVVNASAASDKKGGDGVSSGARPANIPGIGGVVDVFA